MPETLERGWRVEALHYGDGYDLIKLSNFLEELDYPRPVFDFYRAAVNVELGLSFAWDFEHHIRMTLGLDSKSFSPFDLLACTVCQATPLEIPNP